MERKQRLFFETKNEYLFGWYPEKVYDSKFFDGLLDYEKPVVTVYCMKDTHVDVALENRHEKGFFGSSSDYPLKDIKCTLSRVKNTRSRWKLEVEIEDISHRIPAI